MPLRQVRRVRGAECAALAALALLLACSRHEPAAPLPGPSEAPEVHLEAVAIPERGLPDPCEVLEAAGAEALLVRPLEESPRRVGGLCLVQVKRGDRPAPQVSAALELAVRERPQPESLEDYLLDYGEGLTFAGAARDDVEVLSEPGDFAVWFPHADGSLTLSAFFGGHDFLSVDVHGIETALAFEWAEQLAARLIERVRSARVETSGSGS